MPDPNELTIHIYAAIAQHERNAIGQHTKAALAPMKGAGKLGNLCFKEGKQVDGSGDTSNARASRQVKAAACALEMLHIVQDFQGEGITSLQNIATALNEQGYQTYAGKA